MTVIALATALGSPDVTTVVPITTNNLAALIATAQTDTTTADTNAATVVTDTTTADTNVGTVVTNAATVVTDTTSADTKVGTVQTDNTTTLAALDAFAAAVIAITGDGYTAHQFTFGGSTGLTSAQVHTTFALLNTAITNFLTGQTDTNTAKTATALAKTDAATLNTNAATAKTATALAKTDAATLKTSTALAKTDAAAIIPGTGGNNVLIQFDTAAVTTLAALSGAVASEVAFAKAAGILS